MLTMDLHYFYVSIVYNVHFLFKVLFSIIMINQRVYLLDSTRYSKQDETIWQFSLKYYYQKEIHGDFARIIRVKLFDSHLH